MKKFLYIFAFILCFTFVSCNWNSKTENYSETGTVKINLNNSQRTVAPNVNWSLPNTTDSSAWQGWRFVFTNEKNETTEIADRFPSDYQLIVGNYTLEVYGNIVQTSSGTGGTSTGGNTTSTGGTESIIGSSSSSGSNISLYGKSKTFTVSSDKEASVSVFISLSKFGTGAFDYTITLDSETRINSENPAFIISLTSLDGSTTFEFQQNEISIDPDMPITSSNNQTYTYYDGDLTLKANTIPSGYYMLSVEYIDGVSLYKISVRDNLIEIADGLTTSGRTEGISNYNRTYYATNGESLGNGSSSDARINFIEILRTIAEDEYYVNANIYCDFKLDFDDVEFTKVVSGMLTPIVSICYGSSNDPVVVGVIRSGKFTPEELQTTVTDIGAFLSRLPLNTKDDPYSITIRDATEYKASDLNSALISEQGPYINLDLSSTNMTSFDTRGFEACLQLISVRLPDSLTRINERGFSGCSNLTEVILPANIEEINLYCFLSCTSLENISIPAKLAVMDKYVFSRSGIKNIYFNGTALPAFDLSTFTNSNSLSKVNVVIGAQIKELLSVLPENTEVIQDSIQVNQLAEYLSNLSVASFANTPFYFSIEDDFSSEESIASLKSVINNYTNKFVHLDLRKSTGLTVIGSDSDTAENNAFGLCTNLAGIDFPSTVTEIGAYSFYKSGLTSITIPEGVTKINTKAFAETPNLSEVRILGKEPNIQTDSFDYAINLSTLRYSGTVTEWFDSYLYNCFDGSILTDVYFNSQRISTLEIENCESIPSGAFKNYKCIESVIFGAGVKDIGPEAFFNCSELMDVSFGADVNVIANKAFGNCEQLVVLTFKNATPPGMAPGCFDNEVEGSTAHINQIKVPSGSKTDYHTSFNTSASFTLYAESMLTEY